MFKGTMSYVAQNRTTLVVHMARTRQGRRGSTCFTVGNDIGRGHGAEGLKGSTERVVGGVPRKASNEYFAHYLCFV